MTNVVSRYETQKKSTNRDSFHMHSSGCQVLYILASCFVLLKGVHVSYVT